jgi:hypothetical protein
MPQKNFYSSRQDAKTAKKDFTYFSKLGVLCAFARENGATGQSPLRALLFVSHAAEKLLFLAPRRQARK